MARLWRLNRGIGRANAKVLIILAGLWPTACLIAVMSLGIFGIIRAVWSRWQPVLPMFPAVTVMAGGVGIKMLLHLMAGVARRAGIL